MNCYRQLSQAERSIIGWLRQRKWSLRQIAELMQRSPSTVSREVRRNCARHDGGYRAEGAQFRCNARRRKSRTGTQFTPEQWSRIRQKLKRKWSPQQISGRLELEGVLSISHETIYRYIRRDRKAGGRLYCYCRIMPKYGRRGYGVRDYRGRLEGKRHISERPPQAEQRVEVGHWEGDTVMGRDRYHGVLTLVERATGFAIIQKIPARTAEQVTAAARRAIASHRSRFRTLTLDNGTEFHNYKELEASTAVVCYFATPYHAWERGSNENFNGLFRQYVSKGTSMRDLTQARCDLIAREINTRPRKRLSWRTPKELYDEAA